MDIQVGDTVRFVTDIDSWNIKSGDVFEVLECDMGAFKLNVNGTIGWLASADIAETDSSICEDTLAVWNHATLPEIEIGVLL